MFRKKSKKNSTPIPLIKSTFYLEGKTKKELCAFILQSSRLSMFEKCDEFEKKFAKFQGKKYCTLLTSGSTANLALIRALVNLDKIRPGNAAAYSAVTWATNVMPMLQHNLKIIPVDVETETLNCSSKTLKETLKKHPEIKMFFITNVLGFCSDIDEIQNICKERNIILIEDNCESLGTIYKGKKLGSYGEASTFSFYVGHHMSTIEGGAVCTDDEELDTMLRMVRAHGLDRNLNNKHKKKLRSKYNLDEFYSRYAFYSTAYNLRPTEITGFLGVNQLKYIDTILASRNSNFLHFASATNKNDVIPLKYSHIDFVSNFAFPIICNNKKTLNRYISAFERNNIEIRPVVSGDITQQPFMKNYQSKNISLPNTQKIHNHGFYFGNNPDMTDQEIHIITNLLRSL